jgi:hypothetical protein
MKKRALIKTLGRRLGLMLTAVLLVWAIPVRPVAEPLPDGIH